MLVLVLACTRTSEPIEPEIPSADAPAAPSPAEAVPDSSTAAAPEATRHSVVGAWSSPSCGERTHERFIHFTGEGRFSGEERIAPCPPDVACMWSGIHTFTGDWSVAEDTLTLALSSTDAEGSVADSWPRTLTYSGGRLLEGECLYGPDTPAEGAR